ncbi:MAG: lysophospholipid acyltransferase family protein [Terriglobia bacterium]
MIEAPENLDDITSESSGKARGRAKLAAKESPRRFSLRQRAQIFLASWAGSLANRLVGSSLRWEVIGWENWEAACQMGKGLIYTFWHREIFAATWFWRKRGIVVMTSRNFDGEIIARIISRQGYGAARGSSSRGATRALVEMIRCLRRGSDAAFTIDGPRSPRFVAKGGSVLLSRATGAAIVCFHIALRDAHVFEKSWDRHQIPYPFSRAAIFIAPPIVVPGDADAAAMEQGQSQVQATLDDLRRQGDEWVRRTRQTGESCPTPQIADRACPKT